MHPSFDKIPCPAHETENMPPQDGYGHTFKYADAQAVRNTYITVSAVRLCKCYAFHNPSRSLANPSLFPTGVNCRPLCTNNQSIRSQRGYSRLRVNAPIFQCPSTPSSSPSSTPSSTPTRWTPSLEIQQGAAAFTGSPLFSEESSRSRLLDDRLNGASQMELLQATDTLLMCFSKLDHDIGMIDFDYVLDRLNWYCNDINGPHWDVNSLISDEEKMTGFILDLDDNGEVQCAPQSGANCKKYLFQSGPPKAGRNSVGCLLAVVTNHNCLV